MTFMSTDQKPKNFVLFDFRFFFFSFSLSSVVSSFCVGCCISRCYLHNLNLNLSLLLLLLQVLRLDDPRKKKKRLWRVFKQNLFYRSFFLLFRLYSDIPLIFFLLFNTCLIFFFFFVNSDHQFIRGEKKMNCLGS